MVVKNTKNRARLLLVIDITLPNTKVMIYPISAARKPYKLFRPSSCTHFTGLLF